MTDPKNIHSKRVTPNRHHRLAGRLCTPLTFIPWRHAHESHGQRCHLMTLEWEVTLHYLNGSPVITGTLQSRVFPAEDEEVEESGGGELCKAGERQEPGWREERWRHVGAVRKNN